MSPKKVRALICREGEDKLMRQLENGAALLVTPHLGNWEMGGAYFGLHGYRVSAVAESLGMDNTFFPGLTAAVFRKFRKKNGIVPDTFGKSHAGGAGAPRTSPDPAAW